MPTGTLRHTLPPLLAGLLLAGCAVGPDYRRPEVALPQQFSVTLPAAASGQQAVPADWWTLFGDATLNGLVEQALMHNQDVRLAVARLEEAEGLLREAGAAQLPRVDLTGNGSRSRVSQQTQSYNAGSPVHVSASKLALTTSFELDLWGKLRRATEAVRAQALGSQFARDTVRLSLAGQVVQQYLLLRTLDAQQLVTKQTLEGRENSLKITESRQQAGLASPLDVQQAEGARAAVQAQQAVLRQQRAVAEHQLAWLLARPGFTLSEGDLRSIPLPPVIPVGLPSSLLENRPDVRQAEQELIAANARIGVARAAFFPTLSLTGSFGGESRDLANLFRSNAGIWSLAAGLTQPVFDAGGIAARYDQATARQQQALLAYQKAAYNAFRETHDALSSLDNTAAAESAQQARVQAAEASLKLVESRYRAGYVPYLQVLDAQRTLYDAQMSFISSRQTRLQGMVDLFKALGGGWQGEKIVSATRQ